MQIVRELPRTKQLKSKIYIHADEKEKCESILLSIKDHIICTTHAHLCKYFNKRGI